MKNKILKNVFIAIPFLLLILSCNEKIVECIDQDFGKGIVSLSVNKAEIGQKITAHFINMDSVYVYDVTLNQKKITFSQIDDTTITLIVPFSDVGNDVGNFVFYGYMPTDTVLVSNQLNYKSNDCNNYPCIKWNVNEKITKYDSKQAWSYQTINDTVKFIRNITCHDECGITETLVFLNYGNNTLPLFLYALYDKNESMNVPIHEKISGSSRCKIIIDEWSANSIYSGTFTSPEYSWVFWYQK